MQRRRFLTDKLNVTLYEPNQGNNKKRKEVSPFQQAMNRHKKFFNNPIVKFLMRYKAVRFVLGKLFVKRKAKNHWPEWLPKTGSERIQNIPNY